MTGVDVVTGAFGYTGSFIAERLLAGGRQVRTLTRRPPDGHPLGARVETVPLRFDEEGSLIAALRAVDTLYNTYWRRFPRPGAGFADIVAQSGLLIGAASRAGVRRVVHFSVSNASDDAPTSYFRAKAQVEQIVRASGISYAILRPTLLYGPGDILLNNLAWTLRRVPVFGIPGAGDYRVQAVLVTDVAVNVGGQGSSDWISYKDTLLRLRDQLQDLTLSSKASPDQVANAATDLTLVQSALEQLNGSNVLQSCGGALVSGVTSQVTVRWANGPGLWALDCS